MTAGSSESPKADGAPIFVTVGTQLPFPRLIDAVDRIAPSLGRPVIAQVGPEPEPNRWRNIEVAPFLDTSAFAALAGRAAVVVGHAGIGTYLTARSHGVPAVLAPRSAALGEHRNEHQRATARRLEGRPGLSVAWDMEALGPLIEAALTRGAKDGVAQTSAGGSLGDLIARIAVEIDGT